MKPRQIWILLANSRTARIFVHAGPDSGLVERTDLGMTAEPENEFADAPGRSFSSTGPERSAMEPHHAGTGARDAFARRLAARLGAALQEKAFDGLIVSAAPAMLGALRTALPQPVRAQVLAEIDKDLTGTETSQLGRHFADVIAV